MIDLAKLAGQGRAYSGARAWEVEELDALLLLERERGLGRLAAADYVRNGILTLEDFDKAAKAAFKPKTLDDAAEEAEATLKDNDFATETADAAEEAEVENPAPAKKKGKK